MVGIRLDEGKRGWHLGRKLDVASSCERLQEIDHAIEGRLDGKRNDLGLPRPRIIQELSDDARDPFDLLKHRGEVPVERIIIALTLADGGRLALRGGV